jgi:hypothetical protein
LQLGLTPRGAERFFDGSRSAIAASTGARSRVAAGDRRAVEAREELVLFELEPPSERPARSTLPGTTRRRLYASGCESEEIGALTGVALEDGSRLDREAGVEAETAAAVTALVGSEGGSPGHRERTTTNQSPA